MPADDTTLKLASGILTEIFKECLSGLKTVSKTLYSTGNHLIEMQTAAHAYARAVGSRYNVVRILGMQRPVPLEDLYVEVNVLERTTASRRATIDNLLDSFHHQKRRLSSSAATRPGIEIVNRVNRLVVIGKPGSGKTTFLRHILLRALHGRLGRRRLPIFVSLKRAADAKRSITEQLAEEFRLAGVALAAELPSAALARGKALLLLDGLDEVPADTRQSVLEEIRQLSDASPNSQIILSSRMIAYNAELEHFTTVEVAEFGDTQIDAFIDQWYVDPDKALGCKHALRQSPGARELAGTPLLLAMLCLAYDDSLDFSRNRSELYRDAIEALLKRWDVSRGIRRVEFYKGLTPKRREELLSQLATVTFEDEAYFFSRERAAALIVGFLATLRSDNLLPAANAPRTRAKSNHARQRQLERDAEAARATTLAGEDIGACVLEGIVEQHGIIVERAHGVYSFSHLSLQEYLVAVYLANVAPANIETLVDEYLFDVRWREVILLAASILPDANALVLRAIEVIARRLLGMEPSLLNSVNRIRRNRVQSISERRRISPPNPESLRVVKATRPALPSDLQLTLEFLACGAGGIGWALKQAAGEVARILTNAIHLDIDALDKTITTRVEEAVRVYAGGDISTISRAIGLRAIEQYDEYHRSHCREIKIVAGAYTAGELADVNVLTRGAPEGGEPEAHIGSVLGLIIQSIGAWDSLFRTPDLPENQARSIVRRASLRFSIEKRRDEMAAREEIVALVAAAWPTLARKVKELRANTYDAPDDAVAELFAEELMSSLAGTAKMERLLRLAMGASATAFAVAKLEQNKSTPSWRAAALLAEIVTGPSRLSDDVRSLGVEALRILLSLRASTLSEA